MGESLGNHTALACQGLSKLYLLYFFLFGALGVISVHPKECLEASLKINILFPKNMKTKTLVLS